MRSPVYKNYADGITPNSDKPIIISTASKVNKSTTNKTGTKFSVMDEGENRLELRDLGMISII
jgi:hypothetical protein